MCQLFVGWCFHKKIRLVAIPDSFSIWCHHSSTSSHQGYTRYTIMRLKGVLKIILACCPIRYGAIFTTILWITPILTWFIMVDPMFIPWTFIHQIADAEVQENQQTLQQAKEGWMPVSNRVIKNKTQQDGIKQSTFREHMQQNLAKKKLNTQKWSDGIVLFCHPWGTSPEKA